MKFGFFGKAVLLAGFLAVGYVRSESELSRLNELRELRSTLRNQWKEAFDELNELEKCKGYTRVEATSKSCAECPCITWDHCTSEQAAQILKHKARLDKAYAMYCEVRVLIGEELVKRALAENAANEEFAKVLEARLAAFKAKN